MHLFCYPFHIPTAISEWCNSDIPELSMCLRQIWRIEAWKWGCPFKSPSKASSLRTYLNQAALPAGQGFQMQPRGRFLLWSSSTWSFAILDLPSEHSGSSDLRSEFSGSWRLHELNFWYITDYPQFQVTYDKLCHILWTLKPRGSGVVN